MDGRGIAIVRQGPRHDILHLRADQGRGVVVQINAHAAASMPQAVAPIRAWPGRFSIISLRTDAQSPPRVSLYLRPVEFELPPDALAQAV